MVLEVINRNQQVIRAGLRPRTAYSRIVAIQLSTPMGNNEVDNQESSILASQGIIHHIWIHSHGTQVNGLQQGVISVGLGVEVEMTTAAQPKYRQRLIQNHGGRDNTVPLSGVDVDFEMEMQVQFIGDKTRLHAGVLTSNTFASDYVIIFQISEG